jgi:predicted RNase H-like HicB family nuclease
VRTRSRDAHRPYTIFLDPDVEEGGYTVTVPYLPGCVTEGETIEECLVMARDAIALYVASLVDAGEPVSQETVRPQAITIDVLPSDPAPAAVS